MRKLNINKFTKALIFMAVFLMLFTYKENSVKSAEVNMYVEKRKSTDDKAVIIIKGKIKELNDIDLIYRPETGDSALERKLYFKKISKNKWKATYKMKKRKYGNYNLSISYYVISNGKYIYRDLQTEWKFKNKKSKELGIGRPSKTQSPGGVGFFQNEYFMIDKGKGNIRYIKPGIQVNITVLYKRAVNEPLRKNEVYIMCGSHKVIPQKVGSMERKDAVDGCYYMAAMYVIRADGDYSGKITLFYSDGKGGFVSKSTGYSLGIDGMAPEIIIDSKYTGEIKKYVNKKVSVPITIKEKYFDEKNTKIVLNKKSVNVSWSGSGNIHQTKVKLKEGKNKISVISTDKAGNKSKERKSSEIVIDIKNPNVKIKGFENGKSKGMINGERKPFPMTIIIEDNEKISAENAEIYKLSDDGKKKNIVPLKKEESGNAVKYYVEDIEDDGYYLLHVYVRDNAGNIVSLHDVQSEGKNKYNIKRGIITGGFTINRVGSYYLPQKEELFCRPIKDAEDIVVYEYNRNEVSDSSVMLVKNDISRNRTLTKNIDYTFKQIKSDNPQYKYKYVYRISKKNFSEGSFYIKIYSKSIVGENGTLIAKIQESNSLNKQIEIDKTSPKILSFEGTCDGVIKVKIRDNHMDLDSVKVRIGEKEYVLECEQENSTSTNITFSGKVGHNIEEAIVYCRDLAGNETKSENINIIKNNRKSIDFNTLVWALGIITILGTGGGCTIMKMKKKKK